jgi:hypothetical protein
MYESPIKLYEQITDQLEGEILKSVMSVGVVVDRDELLKALKYDRDQYHNGFRDGRESFLCCEYEGNTIINKARRFLQKELKKHKRNKELGILRNAPRADIDSLSEKIEVTEYLLWCLEIINIEGCVEE